ncbi:MAG: right-handed parallel beta-helix repeat-containing protein [Candidatus Omnitrophica bacterium]|nr:right-handed parallel beta-helix repeat-containing protein [Candidatus Omnitrophota bacterium]
MSVYNIMDFGAVADGKTKNTEAIRKAIDACHQAGGGKVLCGPGSFVTGSLVLKSNVELHLAAGCRILGSTSLDDYEDFAAPGFIGTGDQVPEKSTQSLIRAVEAENIAITGTGEINGSGLAFYDAGSADTTGKLSKPPTPRPRIGMFYKCRNVRFEDVSFIDSACWTLWLMKCREVNVHRVKISGNRRMRNNDGINIDSCRNVTVSDSFFDTEDDCLAVRAIQQMYDTPAVCENITVNNCVLESQCKGILIGCPGDALIRNCTFSNLVINNAAKGIAIEHPKCYLPEGNRGTADIHDIMFSNITINCSSGEPKNPIRVYVEEGVELKRLANLSFSNIRIKSGGPCLVQGSRETTIQNVSFSNVEIETSGEDAIICRNCRDVKLTNVNLSNRPEPLPDGK